MSAGLPELWEETFGNQRDTANLDWCTRILSTADWEAADPAKFARNLIIASHALGNFERPGDPPVPIFPSLTHQGIFRVMAALGAMVEKDPSDTRALSALVRFFNFNLRINTACGQDCPA